MRQALAVLLVAFVVAATAASAGARSYFIPHLNLWLCIHAREGAWTAATGNGYYGGLQMSYGWEGLVTNAALLSPYRQMAAAEKGYVRHGYSRTWLFHQWPRTAPPCSGLA